jgi:hypothetical protein
MNKIKKLIAELCPEGVVFIHITGGQYKDEYRD